MDEEEKLIQLATVVGKLKRQVSELSSKSETISKQRGPQGEQGLPGKDGKDGLNGRDGLDGKNGRDGKDGIDGKDGDDGVSVVDVELDFDNSFVFSLSDGSMIKTSPLEIDFKGDSTSIVNNKQTADVEFIVNSAVVPVFLEANEGFSVPKNKQMLFSDEIELSQGAFITFNERSVLIEVD
jgi:hypothetical protein